MKFEVAYFKLDETKPEEDQQAELEAMSKALAVGFRMISACATNKKVYYTLVKSTTSALAGPPLDIRKKI